MYFGNLAYLDCSLDLEKGEMDNDPPFLPLELVMMILSLLTTKPLVRFKCVSKSWYDLINSPDFIKLQLN